MILIQSVHLPLLASCFRSKPIVVDCRSHARDHQGISSQTISVCSTSDLNALSIWADILRTPHSSRFEMIFTNDRVRELDNRLLLASTENMKQMGMWAGWINIICINIFHIYCSQIDQVWGETKSLFCKSQVSLESLH